MEEYLMNRLANCRNPYQGKFKRVLCVCSAGLLRSPTAAFVLSREPFNFNTRAAGITKEFALIPVDKVLLGWADEVVCMNAEQKKQLQNMLEDDGETSVINLDIEDNYCYRDPELMEKIKQAYNRETA